MFTISELGRGQARVLGVVAAHFTTMMQVMGTGKIRHLQEQRGRVGAGALRRENPFT